MTLATRSSHKLGRLPLDQGPITVRVMRRSLQAGALVAVASALALAAPVAAHGDHDARPLAGQVPAGPYSVSLWQVYPDAGDAMTPHLIVMVDGGTQAPAEILVSVNATPAQVMPSTTTRNGWETMQGLATGDVVEVTVSDGAQAWELAPVVVPPPQTAMLPMQELIYASIVLTAATAVWVARRTTRVWRRPTAIPT